MKRLILAFLILFLLQIPLFASSIINPKPQTNIEPNYPGSSDQFSGYFTLVGITGQNNTTNNSDGTVTIACGSFSGALLYEDATLLLQEDGGKLILEQ